MPLRQADAIDPYEQVGPLASMASSQILFRDWAIPNAGER